MSHRSISLKSEALSPMHTGRSSTASIKAPSPQLHYEDVRAALLNMLHPRNCESLNIQSHELASMDNTTISSLKAGYSLLVENKTKNCKAIMAVKQQSGTIDMQRLFTRELTFYRYLESQIRHMMVQVMESPIPRCFLARGQCEEPRHRNPSMPFHKGPPEPGCDVEGEPPVIILQDLEQDGYRHSYTKSEMNYQQCAAALKALATFHAASAVLDRTDPKLKRGSFLRSAFPFLVPERGLFWQTENLFDKGMKVIGILGPHIDPKILLPFKNVIKIINFMNRNLHTLLVNILKPHETQLNTLCHTNCIDSNNFLFLHDQKHRSVACKLIGLSQVRYCRPAVDICLVLFCAANLDIRTTKVEILREVYREQFNKALELCQKKHHTALPFSAGLLSSDQLQESMEQTKLYAVALRAFLVATEPLGSFDSISDKELVKTFTKNEKFRVKFIDTIRDLLLAVEPYAGDCNLYTHHRQCPHLPTNGAKLH